MIHHLSFGANDIERAGACYVPVLAVVGIRRMKTRETALDDEVGALLIRLKTPVDGKPATPGNVVHVAFAAEGRAMVDEFYRTALAHGGSDAGPPGLRAGEDIELARDCPLRFLAFLRHSRR